MHGRPCRSTVGRPSLRVIRNFLPSGLRLLSAIFLCHSASTTSAISLHGSWYFSSARGVSLLRPFSCAWLNIVANSPAITSVGNPNLRKQSTFLMVCSLYDDQRRHPQHGCDSSAPCPSRQAKRRGNMLRRSAADQES